MTYRAADGQLGLNLGSEALRKACTDIFNDKTDNEATIYEHFNTSGQENTLYFNSALLEGEKYLTFENDANRTPAKAGELAPFAQDILQEYRASKDTAAAQASAPNAGRGGGRGGY